MSLRLAFTALALACSATTTLAQHDKPAPQLLEVLRDSRGTRVSIDSAALIRTDSLVSELETTIEFADTMELPDGALFNHEVDSEEIDCAANRVRLLRVVNRLGDSVVLTTHSVAPEWAPVAAERMPLFRARCDFLGTALSGLPLTKDVSQVEQPPSLSNVNSVQGTLIRTYPTALRDAGIGGTVTVTMVIDERGHPARGTIRTSTRSHPEFEWAARQVAGSMRFRPARVRGQPVRVRISVPITYQSGLGPDFVPPPGP